MKTQNPNFKDRVESIFKNAPFINQLGITLIEINPGYLKTELKPQANQLQQHGLIHAGVITTLADHTAGGAGESLISENESVLSVEFKINFLRPAVSNKNLTGKAQVIKNGKTLIIVDAEVWQENQLIAKSIVTLVRVKNK